MSCDYKIHGEVTLRITPEVRKAVESLRSDILGQDYVDLEDVGANICKLRIDYDDVNTVNTPDHVKDVLDALSSAVIGSGAFEITTGGETWIEWIGEAEAVRQDKSSAALRIIEVNVADLVPEDIKRALELLRRGQSNG